MPDVQAGEPDVSVGLNRVGVEKVEKLVEIARPDKRPYVLMAEFEVYVDLPAWRKGADMSRNMEAIDEVLEKAVSEPVSHVTEVCSDAAERLLAKHEYTTRAEVEMEAEFAQRERTPQSNRPTQSKTSIIAGATATEEYTEIELGTEVTGMTVCPCSQGMMEQRAREKLSELGVSQSEVREFLSDVPQAGHSQRGNASLKISGDGVLNVSLQDLIRVARDAMSARIYNLAKRPDEDHMTYQAHLDAKFVEDCVREMAKGVVEEFPNLADDAKVMMRQSNEESIHQHNAHAERVAEFGQLRAEVSN